jgi:hypothetical protein
LRAGRIELAAILFMYSNTFPLFTAISIFFVVALGDMSSHPAISEGAGTITLDPILNDIF